MISIYKFPDPKQRESLLQRPAQKTEDLTEKIAAIFKDVLKNGDEALIKYTALFDKTELQNVTVNSKNLPSDFAHIPEPLKEAIILAKSNIEAFHKSQKQQFPMVENTKGVRCWMETRPIERVGIYIPGGTAPLFSTVLMLAIPAKLAGCEKIVLCTPPNKEGQIHPVIHYVATLLGIENVYAVGGVQAIAALTYGTESIAKVDKIFGPGNQYVTAAKQYAQQKGIAIDMPAGPSEVLVIADAQADASFIASDLLSQAEHGVDSQVVLLTDSEKTANNTFSEIEKQLAALPRKKYAEKALNNSHIIVLPSLEECFDFSNEYAPEHLILALENAHDYCQKIKHAGSVFLGKYSCESLGDYASGTNHTLPTYGFAKNYSGVSLSSFTKTITFQSVSREGLENIGSAVEIMAEAEELQAHKNAVTLRLQSIAKTTKQ